jgi:hypothetical protein
MKSINLACQAMKVIVGNVSPQTLSRTSYCAMVLKLGNGQRVVLIAEAGASARGINEPLLERIENALNAVSPNVAVIGCAAPTLGQGTWHMNDAEQQALQIHSQDDGALTGSVIKAVVANRPICASCTFTLTQHGLVVNGAEATAP